MLCISDKPVKNVLDKLMGFGNLEEAKYVFLGYEEKGDTCIEKERFNIYEKVYIRKLA